MLQYILFNHLKDILKTCLSLNSLVILVQICHCHMSPYFCKTFWLFIVSARAKVILITATQMESVYFYRVQINVCELVSTVWSSNASRSCLHHIYWLHNLLWISHSLDIYLDRKKGGVSMMLNHSFSLIFFRQTLTIVIFTSLV